MHSLVITHPPFLALLGTEAVYHSGSCSPSPDNSIPGCSDTRISNGSQSAYSFLYYTCSTPRITGVAPRIIDATTEVVITGEGFSNTNIHNEVKLKAPDNVKHKCDVLSSTNTQIICKIDTTNNPPINTDMTVSVRVDSRGYAHSVVNNSADAKLKLEPTIDSITPQTGSIAGGTVVIIKGTGLQYGVVTATTGSSSCKITQHSYTEITCVTGKSSNQLVTSNSQMSLIVNGKAARCKFTGVCDYSYQISMTPTSTSISPTEIDSEIETLTIVGTGFGTVTSKVNITIGPTSCLFGTLSDTEITCRVNGLLAGDHSLEVNVGPKGNAWSNVSTIITSKPTIASISPDRGSTQGGTEIAITGNGFDRTLGKTSVRIGPNECIVKTVTFSQIVCTTPPGTGSKIVITESNGKRFPQQTFNYDTSATPTVSSISPTSGHAGQTITLRGANFDTNKALVQVRVGAAECSVSSSTVASITCILGAHPASAVPVNVYVKGKGNSNNDTTFIYDLALSGVSPDQSGFGGGINITVSGYGFGDDTVVKVCDRGCNVFKETVTDTQLICEVPPNPDRNPRNDATCSVSVTSVSNVVKTLENSYTYRDSLTSTVTAVSPARGGTGGGVRVTIAGTDFDTSQGATSVTIAGVPCVIDRITTTEIQCVTGPSSKTIKTNVRVNIGSNGKALVINGSFYYVDVWSSKFTWGGKNPPVKGTCPSFFFEGVVVTNSVPQNKLRCFLAIKIRIKTVAVFPWQSL